LYSQAKERITEIDLIRAGVEVKGTGYLIDRYPSISASAAAIAAATIPASGVLPEVTSVSSSKT
jgi:hypothetical protein